MQRLNSSDSTFYKDLAALTSWSAVADVEFENVVRSIISDVIEKGDDAIIEKTRNFDNRPDFSINEMEVSQETMREAYNALGSSLKNSLEMAAKRIEKFHERQKMSSWQYKDEEGTLLGQKVTPLDRVGVYVPGGKAAYPSSVLMNVIPAKVAEVKEIIMVSPAPGGELNQTVLAAAALSGVSRFFTIGGAQAIAALAYGTSTIPRVDKITGPGNRYVAAAKKMVFGQVGLDMVAGPSEILIVCDGKTDPEWIAMDLFSQAEHDEDAQAILISSDKEFLLEVEKVIERLLPTMERKDVIAASLKHRGAMILVKDLNEAIEVVNVIAPEHLELSVDNAESYLPNIRHAGAVFLGRYTPEAFGDYCAGPNHVLPTSTTARFASPLGVYDFQKRTSLIQCSATSATKLSECATTLALSESLTAHARSAEFRK